MKVPETGLFFIFVFMEHQLDKLKQQIKPYQEQLLNHPINHFINDFQDLQKFMQVHSFAVWDFMSLVKKLQQDLTCTTLPWKPKGNPQTRRLINEIVFGEESDIDQFGNPISHFELYIRAMKELNISPLSALNQLISAQSIPEVLRLIEQIDIDSRLKEFLNFTFYSLQEKEIHEIASIFTFGREDLIPSMFTKIVSHLKNDPSKNLDTFIYYLDRHIEVDGDSHSHLAYDMMIELCGEDAAKWIQATNAAIESLRYRKLLWDSIVD